MITDIEQYNNKSWYEYETIARISLYIEQYNKCFWISSIHSSEYILTNIYIRYIYILINVMNSLIYNLNEKQWIRILTFILKWLIHMLIFVLNQE